MPATNLTFPGYQNKKLHGKLWTPADTSPNAIILIIHGIAEHKERYNHFSKFLSTNGSAVVCYDQRGHGQTDPNHLGIIVEEGGFELLIKDLHEVTIALKERYPNLPVLLMGHSMGSFIVQRFMQLYGFRPDGLIYSGSNGRPPLTLSAGIALSSLLISLYGPDAKSLLINRLSFESYNSKFKPNRTKFDWLSRDASAVNLYIDDPYCGFICSNAFYHQFFTCLRDLHKHPAFADQNKEIPMLLISGDQDPVSSMGKGIKNLEKMLRKDGVQNLTVKLYRGGRHEMLNEINRDEVYQDILQWINQQFGQTYLRHPSSRQFSQSNFHKLHPVFHPQPLTDGHYYFLQSHVLQSLIWVYH